MVQTGIVEPAEGAWRSLAVLVCTKDHSWQLCVDYRRLIAVTQKDAYLPTKDSLDALFSRIFFSILDLVRGYWQVPLDQKAKERSAFNDARWVMAIESLFGHYHLVLLQPPMFKKPIETVLKSLQ